MQLFRTRWRKNNNQGKGRYDIDRTILFLRKFRQEICIFFLSLFTFCIFFKFSSFFQNSIYIEDFSTFSKTNLEVKNHFYIIFGTNYFGNEWNMTADPYFQFYNIGGNCAEVNLNITITFISSAKAPSFQLPLGASAIIFYHSRDVKDSYLTLFPGIPKLIFVLESPLWEKTDHDDVLASYNMISTYAKPRFPNEISHPYWARKELDWVYRPLRRSFESKTRNVGFGQTNCLPWRSRPVKNMMELGLQIDAYGECLNNSKPIPRYSDELSNYKFIIVMENSLCRDYITEKPFENAFAHDAIPIIARWEGWPDYFMLPKNSFIDIFSFPSLNAAVEHIQRVSKDRKLWMSYMKHRGNSIPKEFLKSRNPFCDTAEFVLTHGMENVLKMKLHPQEACNVKGNGHQCDPWHYRPTKCNTRSETLWNRDFPNIILDFL